MNTRRISMAVVVLSLAAGPIAQGQTATFQHQNTAENLKALMQRVFQLQKSPREGAALFRSLFPDETRLRAALKADVPAETVRNILDFQKKFASAPDDVVAKVAEPTQTNILVHGASTEDIQRNQEGSVAYAEFPGGARQLANRILRPKMTFYEVEFLEPGKDAGMKYHLFYWDGRQWSMLGPIWRLVVS